MRIACVVATLVVLCPASATAQDAPAAHARSLAATCASCHSGADAALPALAGMPESELARAMQDFKSGARPGTVMPQLAKGYTDAQIAAIASWYAKAKR